MKSVSRLAGKRRRRIVGLMSGTSADGVDAALVDVESLPDGGALTWELQDFLTVPYRDAVREEILGVQEGGERAIERLTRLHFVLGHLFADAVLAVIRDSGAPLPTVDAVASHGQTVCHFPAFPARVPDGEGEGAEAWSSWSPAEEAWVSRATLQIGEPSVIAERTGLCVVSNFRSRDVAAGGTGAPLVPLVDHLLFADGEKTRLVLNVGGIANVTSLPAGAALEDVVAFDTGPGNMVVDAVTARVTGGRSRFDEGGALARRGRPDRDLVATFLEEPFFCAPPPKAAGRGQFGSAFTERFLSACKSRKLSEASTVATATWLTAAAVADACRRFLFPRGAASEVIVGGGGAHNVALMEYLSELFEEASVVPTDYYGLDVDAKEATAFALLAHLTLEGRPGNLPGVTGASRRVLLGDITPGDRFP